MQHMVTQLEAPNEPYASKFSILGNYTLDFFFGDFEAQHSFIPLDQNSKFSLTDITEEGTGTILASTSLSANDNIEFTNSTSDTKTWTIFIDASKSFEEVGDGCLIINP